MTPSDECCTLAPEGQCCPERRLPANVTCPACGSRLRIVSAAQVMHHIVKPSGREIDREGDYWFCPGQSCEVVYVGPGGALLYTADLRHPPAYKTKNTVDLLCYCFDVTGAEVLSPGAETAVAFISDRVRAGDCACDVLNPSAGCCLGSIARYRKDARDCPTL